MSLYPSLKVPEDANTNFSQSSTKKVLYFSDGTLEVDETDEDSSVKLDSTSVPVNPQELTWFPWMWYQALTAGSKALGICDSFGESLASFFGITTPKYQFEINEYNRLKKEAEEESAKNDIEMGSWTKKYSSNDSEKEMISTGPKVYNSINDKTFNLS